MRQTEPRTRKGRMVRTLVFRLCLFSRRPISLSYTGVNHPHRRHPHWADGQHRAGGGDGGDVEMSHLSEMLGRDTAMVGMRGPYLSVPSLVLSPHCAASPLVWC